MPLPALLRYLAMLAVGTVAGVLLFAFVHRFGVRWLALGRRGSRVLAAALAAAMSSLWLGRIAGRLIGGPSFAMLAIAGTLALAAMLAVGVLFAIVALFRALRRRPVVPPVQAGETSGRRVFLARAATGAAGAGAAMLGAHGVFGVRRAWSIEEIEVRIVGLPRTLDGYTIAQISDLHLGLFADADTTRVAEQLIRRARADAIVITGDLVDNHPRDIALAARLVRRLAGLSTRDGVFAIAGNHEHYVGADEVLAALRRAGAATLVNESRTIGEGRIALLGVDDSIAASMGYPAAPDLRAAVASAEPDLPRILLAHDPRFFVRAAPHVQLQLSGHTHGGQVSFFGLRPTELLLGQDYVAGLYERDGATLYVNRGFGTTGPPLRLEVTPEVTRVILVSA